MPENLLRRIQRMNLLLGMTVMAGAGLLSGPRAAVAAGAGALIAGANFHVLGRLALTAKRRVESGGAAGPAVTAFMAGLLGKMIALGLVVGAVLVLFTPAPAPFVAGLAVFVVSTTAHAGAGWSHAPSRKVA